MASLIALITNQPQSHPIPYTAVRVRFQRSGDGGVTWTDVQSEIRGLGTTGDAYTIPANTAGAYRAGAALTDGSAVAAEVFSNTLHVGVLATPVAIAISLVVAP